MFGGMLWPWMWVGGDEVRLPHRVRRWDADGVAVIPEVPRISQIRDTSRALFLSADLCRNSSPHSPCGGTALMPCGGMARGGG